MSAASVGRKLLDALDAALHGKELFMKGVGNTTELDTTDLACLLVLMFRPFVENSQASEYAWVNRNKHLALTTDGKTKQAVRCTNETLTSVLAFSDCIQRRVFNQGHVDPFLLDVFFDHDLGVTIPTLDGDIMVMYIAEDIDIGVKELCKSFEENSRLTDLVKEQLWDVVNMAIVNVGSGGNLVSSSEVFTTDKTVRHTVSALLASEHNCPSYTLVRKYFYQFSETFMSAAEGNSVVDTHHAHFKQSVNNADKITRTNPTSSSASSKPRTDPANTVKNIKSTTEADAYPSLVKELLAKSV